MKILITNTVALNGGDAAILLAIIDRLTNAFGQSTQFIIYDSQPEIASRYYPELRFRRLIYSTATKPAQFKILGRVGLYALRYINLLRFYFAAWCWKQGLQFLARPLLSNEEIQDLTNYSSADLIVSTGGTYLVESYPLSSRILDYKISFLFQRPLIFFTQSIGPFNHKGNQITFRKIFDDALLVLLRDELSLKHLHAINVQGSNAQVSSDVVFALADETALEKACHRTFPRNPKLKFAISVRHWSHFKQVSREVGMENFKNAIRQLTQYLVEKLDAEVTFISTCQGIYEYWTNDSKVATEIFETLPESIKSQVVVDTSFHHPLDLLESLKSYDIVIATRMHMAILSLSAGTIVFPIAYEFKTQELFSRLGLGQWVQDIETISADSLINTIESFLNSIPAIQKPLFLNVMNERKQALESSAIIKQVFEAINSRV